MRKVVIKIGTNVITRDSGLLNRPIVNELVKQIGELKKKGMDVIVVTSGAVAAGRSRLGRRARLGDTVVVDKQVLAAVGQVKLMEIYSRLFGAQGYSCAQVLATKGDFRDRRHYLCMQECFRALLHEIFVRCVLIYLQQ